MGHHKALGHKGPLHERTTRARNTLAAWPQRLLCDKPVLLVCCHAVQTADNWGIDPSQCLVPGYGAPRLFDSAAAPTSYPVTYDQKQACNGTVFSMDLVNRFRPENVHGKLFAWKVRGRERRLR